MPIARKLTDENGRFEFAALPNINAAGTDASGGPKPRRFSGVAYSGQVIPNHYWWGNVIFDLSSIEPPAKAFPALVNHDGDAVAGFIDDFNIEPDGIKIGGPLIFADGYKGKYVADGSDAGFPWQMSVCIKPGSIEEVAPGTSVAVNGQSLEGPLTIFRNSKLTEVSFTPTGWDANTSAAAMSRANAAQPPQGDTPMTPEEKARMEQLERDLAAVNASNSTLKASIDAAAAETNALKAAALATRTTAVTQLFADLGQDVKPEATEFKDMLSLPDSTFKTVETTMRASIKNPARTTNGLFSDTATKGKDPKDGGDSTKFDAVKDGEHGLVANARTRQDQMSRKSH